VWRRTTVIQRPCASERLRATAAKRFRRLANDVVWQVLSVAESRSRGLDAPQLLDHVAEGVQFRNRIRLRNNRAPEEATD
jgi:hypothetical protein